MDPAYRDAYEDEAQPPRRRGGRKALVVLVVIVLLLGGLLLAADRMAAGFAERKIADQAAQEIAKQDIKAGQPEVDVAGFPFLTQVLAGKYESITIVVRDATGPVNGKTVDIPELRIEARDVAASLDTLRSGQGEVVADSVSGTGTISYETVARFINQDDLTLAERDGKLTVTAPLDVLGQRLTATGTAKITVREGKVLLGFEDLTVDQLPNIPLARQIVSSYARRISIQLPLPALPYDLQVREVRPTPKGLTVTADARNVPLNAL
ncbi:MAG TPA: DUF2993 domain-containing protein [Micromonospora sp.]